MVDYNKALDRYEAEQAEKKQQAWDNLNPLLCALKKKGVTSIYVEYCGAGDNGSIQDVNIM